MQKSNARHRIKGSTWSLLLMPPGSDCRIYKYMMYLGWDVARFQKTWTHRPKEPVAKGSHESSAESVPVSHPGPDPDARAPRAPRRKPRGQEGPGPSKKDQGHTGMLNLAINISPHDSIVHNGCLTRTYDLN